MPEVELSEQKQQARKMWAGGEYAEIAERIADGIVQRLRRAA
jgi:hypothetical protein